jgi:ABC-2 type transport system permease protein
MRGFSTLFYKELLRFWKVGFQTILAPMVTALLYLLIFSHVLEEHVQVYEGVSYTAFLVPGLVMMTVLQNGFANSSSSLIQSKITGNIIFILLPPLSHWEFFLAYLLAAIVRGLLVGLGVFAVTLWLVAVPLTYPLWVLLFAFLGSGILGAMGIIAGIWADKFDQLAAFQNFIIIPLTFLSGCFIRYIHCPNFGRWRRISILFST